MTADLADTSNGVVLVEIENFNTILQRLAPESDDLVGLVAYGLYKQAKRDWILRYKTKHGGYPALPDMQAYHDHFSDDDLQRFRSQAEGMMLGFAEVLIEDRRPTIEERVRGGEISSIKSTVIASIEANTKFWDQVKASITAWAICLGITTFIIAIFNLPLILDAVKRTLGIAS